MLTLHTFSTLLQNMSLNYPGGGLGISFVCVPGKPTFKIKTSTTKHKHVVHGRLLKRQHVAESPGKLAKGVLGPTSTFSLHCTLKGASWPCCWGLVGKLDIGPPLWHQKQTLTVSSTTWWLHDHMPIPTATLDQVAETHCVCSTWTTTTNLFQVFSLFKSVFLPEGC